MNTKLNRIFVLICVLLATLTIVSCAVATQQPAASSAPAVSSKPAVAAVPVTCAVGAKVDFCGAGFKPGEKVSVRILLPVKKDIAPEETVLGPDDIGQPIQVNDIGSFKLSGVTAPPTAGVYPIRVYDSNQIMSATTVLVVQAPAPAKK